MTQCNKRDSNERGHILLPVYLKSRLCVYAVDTTTCYRVMAFFLLILYTWSWPFDLEGSLCIASQVDYHYPLTLKVLRSCLVVMVLMLLPSLGLHSRWMAYLRSTWRAISNFSPAADDRYPRDPTNSSKPFTVADPPLWKTYLSIYVIRNFFEFGQLPRCTCFLRTVAPSDRCFQSVL